MRFSFIDAKRAEFPVARLCETLEVSQSGYFAWKNRPASERQRKDRVLPSGTFPPIHMPLRFAAAILSRIRSPAISRWNWAKEAAC